MPGVGSTSKSGDTFSLSASGAEFNSRTNDVFSNLDSIERQHSSHERFRSDDSRIRSRSPTEVEPQVSNRRDRHGNRQHQSRESGNRPRSQVDDRHTDSSAFRRPPYRPPRRSYIPDHRRNPQNYTAYDLSTVAEHSDRSNTSAALSFLDDLKKRKESEEEKDKTQQSDFESDKSKGKLWGNDLKYVRRKHAFSKRENKANDPSAEPQPSTSRSKEEASGAAESKESGQAKFVSGKLTMPEYVIGREKEKKKKRKGSAKYGLSCDALSLDHLAEESSVKDDKDEESPIVTTETPVSADKTEAEKTNCETGSEKEVVKVQFKKFKRKTGTRRREDDSD